MSHPLSQPQTIGQIETLSPLVRRVVARNPGPFTATGTGTYIVGHGRVAVIDPGPALPEHIDAILESLRGEVIAHLLITHTHIDHSPAAAALKAATGATTYGFGPHAAVNPTWGESADHAFSPDQKLADGNSIGENGWRMTAIHTPGHTSNHLCYALDAEKTLFTGDHIMGWSTTVIVPPDGNMATYMQSLEKLLDRDDELYLPTHGAGIAAPQARTRELIAHRRARHAAILGALSDEPRTLPDIVREIYTDVDPKLHAIAVYSVLAHVIEMVRNGDAVTDGEATLTARYRRKA